MRCARCGKDWDFKAREERHACKACGRRFAFEPRRDRGMTDMTFKLAIDGVSDGGELAWTDDQLYYALSRRVRRRRIFHRLVRKPVPSVDRVEFDALYRRWIGAHGVPAGRLEGRQFAPGTSVATPEVAAYGFDRLVVCEHESIADVLLANRFHAESRCPVLAFSGYPEDVYATLLPMLRERPPATVVVVHDATWEGCVLPRLVAESVRWFAGVQLPRLVDAGLRPADAKGYRGLWRRGTGERAVTPGIAPAEADWLADHALDLAAARPRVLMAVLARILRGEDDGERDGGGVWSPLPWEDGDDDVG